MTTTEEITYLTAASNLIRQACRTDLAKEIEWSLNSEQEEQFRSGMLISAAFLIGQCDFDDDHEGEDIYDVVCALTVAPDTLFENAQNWEEEKLVVYADDCDKYVAYLNAL